MFVDIFDVWCLMNEMMNDEWIVQYGYGTYVQSLYILYVPISKQQKIDLLILSPAWSSS